VPRGQRLRLVLASVWAVCSLGILRITLFDGSVWFRWVRGFWLTLLALTQFYEFRRILKRDGH
jgi:hypothetical protein